MTMSLIIDQRTLHSGPCLVLELGPHMGISQSDGQAEGIVVSSVNKDVDSCQHHYRVKDLLVTLCRESSISRNCDVSRQERRTRHSELVES